MGSCRRVSNTGRLKARLLPEAGRGGTMSPLPFPAASQQRRGCVQSREMPSVRRCSLSLGWSFSGRGAVLASRPGNSTVSETCGNSAGDMELWRVFPMPEAYRKWRTIGRRQRQEYAWHEWHEVVCSCCIRCRCSHGGCWIQVSAGQIGILAQLGTAIPLVVVFRYLYRLDGGLHLRIWAWSWAVSLTRLVAEMVLDSTSLPPSSEMVILGAGQIGMSLSAFLILWGTLVFVDRRMPRWGLATFLLTVVWIAAALTMDL